MVIQDIFINNALTALLNFPLKSTVSLSIKNQDVSIDKNRAARSPNPLHASYEASERLGA